MIKQFAIIFGCLLAGNLLSLIPQMPVPASIWGLLILAVCLQTGIVRPRAIETVCNFLIRNMAFFFIPPGVGLMLYFNLIKEEWLPITVATLVSFILVLISTGSCFQWFHKIIKGQQKH